MNRLKFLAFAVVALGLWAYLLVSVSPSGATEGVNEVAGSLSGAPAAVAARIESQRSALQAVVVRLAAGNATWLPAPKTGKPEAPTLERFNSVRDVVNASLGDALKGSVVIALANDSGSLMAMGTADAAPADESFAATTIGLAAAPAGTIVAVKGVNYLFYVVPLAFSEKNEVKAAGLVLVGLPLISDANALSAGVAADLGLDAVGIAMDTKLIGSGGKKNDALTNAVYADMKPGLNTVETGTVRKVGPIAFPLFVPTPILTMGIRKNITGTPFDVVAITSTRAPVERTADLQRFAVFGLIGLLVMAIGVTAALGATVEDAPRMVMPPPVTLPPSISKPPQPAAALSMASEAPAAEAHPDDFHFPAQTAAAAAPAPALTLAPPRPSLPEPTSDPFEASAPPAPAQPDSTTAGVVPAVVMAAASKPMTTPFDEPEHTVAYPMGNFASAIGAPAPAPAADPFDAARAQMSADEANQNPFDEPNESTRVATIPAELMKAAQRGGPSTSVPPVSGASGLHKAVTAPAISAPVAPAAGNDEEKHFQDTYKEFVSTREKCGEPADGLTYEKFKGKLLKNKEQLVAKYNCRTVRFQVYVKEGKAALKASPVKD